MNRCFYFPISRKSLFCFLDQDAQGLVVKEMFMFGAKTVGKYAKQPIQHVIKKGG